MSLEKQVEIYTYTLSVISIQLKVKFPCKIFLEHSGVAITSEVTAASPNKFVFNQEITIKNESEKDYIEVIVNLATDKGAKYVGGVLKFVQNDLIGSEGQRIIVPISKCLDSDACCELRVDQVAVSRVSKRSSPRKKNILKSEYQIQANPAGWNNKNKLANEGQTKSEYNFPLTLNRPRFDERKQPTIGPSGMKKNASRANQIGIMDREPVGSTAGISIIQFEVYKEGYNKLKDKYRKQAQTARSQLNKRMALQSSENNLKLELMRFKLKNEQLEKSLLDKNMKIKQLTESITVFQKKELDTKYLKQEVQNKIYTIKHLEETIKTLTKDNLELKNIQSLRSQNEQETIRSLKEDVQKLKREMQYRENELLRQIRVKNDTITKKDYELHTKSEQVERTKCSIEDLEKTISNKTFEWQKILQSQKSTSKAKLQQFKEKLAKIQGQKTNIQQKIKDLEHVIEQKRGDIVKLQYDKKVALQNNDSLHKQNDELKAIRQKYIQLIRQHKIVGEEKNIAQKSKQRDLRLKQTQLEEITQRYNLLFQNSKKSARQLQEKLKATQVKLVENQSQNELYKNQLQKSRRQNDLSTKQINQLKNQIKDLRASIKEKEERFLSLTNELTDHKNKSKQGDYSIKLELQRLKQENEKINKILQEQKIKGKDYFQTINKLELQGNKSKMEWQFKQQRALKELSYAKDKIVSLQTFKTDLQTQIAALNQNLANSKANEKLSNEKIQKMELQAIKSRQSYEKSKKQQKILEQKLQNNDQSIKSKLRELSQQQNTRQTLQKKISQLQGQSSQLKNQLNKETNQKSRNQKIVEILQADIAKFKQEQARLNTIINSREKIEQQLREDIKKQKQDSTKLEMRLAALKKQTDKFKDTIVENLQSVFSSISDASLMKQSINRQSRSIIITEKAAKENVEILNLLTSYGKDARSNMAKLVDQLKIAQRENDKLNSQFSTTVNKCNTTEFQYSQTINRLEEEISEALADKQNIQNKYEQQVFLLEGRIKEKEEAINQLDQQIQQLDFTYKNTRTQLDAYKEEVSRKESMKNKLIEELRQQNQYHETSVALLENNLEKLQQECEVIHAQLEQRNQKVSRLEKELFDLKEEDREHLQQISSLKREIKKFSERCQQINLQLLSEKQENQKLKCNIEEQQKKSSQLRQFLNGLMKQKEQIIKRELQKSEQVLQFQTKIEELKHESQWNQQELKKYKKLEEEMKESLKKSAKALKDQQNAKNEQKNKNNKLTDKIKEKEKQITSKEEIIAKLQQKLKRQKEKLTKDIKELEQQLDEAYQKILSKQRESNQKILSLENENDRLKTEGEKLKQANISVQEQLFIEKNKKEEKNTLIIELQKEITQAQQNLRLQEQKIKEFQEDINSRQEENFKLQGKLFSLESKLQSKQNEKNDKLTNLHGDWESKYESMCEEYEQRLQLAEKQKEFLKERIEQKEKQIRKLVNQTKMQENSISVLKKSMEEKIKSLQEDRLLVLSQKNNENQRLVDQSRANFQSLKAKESETRRINSQLEHSKNTIVKLEQRVKESEEKIKNLNRTYLNQVEQLKKKEQLFKKTKESLASSIWKSEREVRRVVQNGIKKILEVVDQSNTMKVIQVTKPLQQSIVSAISIKMDEKQQ